MEAFIDLFHLLPGHVGVDFGGRYTIKEDSSFSWKIKHNNFILDSNMTNTYLRYAIDCEGNSQDVIIDGNYVKNYSVGIIVILPSYVAAEKLAARYDIYNNVFENMGFSNITHTGAIVLSSEDRQSPCGYGDNFYRESAYRVFCDIPCHPIFINAVCIW